MGDKLVQLKGGEEEDGLQAEEVVAVKKVKVSGYWAPLTSSGTLLVDGFLASSYASFPHDYSQVGLSLISLDCKPKSILTSVTHTQQCWPAYTLHPVIGCICSSQMVSETPPGR